MRIDGLRLRLGEGEELLLARAAAKMRGCRYIRILKKSLDARDKKDIAWVYSVEASKTPIRTEARIYPQVSLSPRRVVVVGSGPAGMFCALRLLAGGIRPLIVERGKCVEERAAQNTRFFSCTVTSLTVNLGAVSFSISFIVTSFSTTINLLKEISYAQINFKRFSGCNAFTYYTCRYSH